MIEVLGLLALIAAAIIFTCLTILVNLNSSRNLSSPWGKNGTVCERIRAATFIVVMVALWLLLWSEV